MPENLLTIIPRGKDNGAWSTTISAGSTVTIPEGYHNGKGTVTANKGTLHRKDWQTNTSGNISINVISTFGIPKAIAQTLSANNFNIRIERFSWYQGWGENTVAKYNVSYDPASCILTGSFVLSVDRTSYYQNITYVSAFWVE